MSDNKQNTEETALNQSVEQEQTELFGLEVVQWINTGAKTAHLRAFAIASDGFEYAVKRTSDGVNSRVKFPNQIPASEWFCYKLAEKCGIATPPCRILYDEAKDEYVFGSRIELASSNHVGCHLSVFLDNVKKAEKVFLNQLCSIYAFDQFIYNIDRHVNNYLYLRSRHAQTLQAFDFSLAAFIFGWPDSNTNRLPSNSTTVKSWGIIKQLAKIPDSAKESAERVLEKLERIQIHHIESIFSEMPESWINQPLYEALKKWWSSNDRNARIQAIKQEIKNA